MKKKFAFLLHFRSYRQDLPLISPLLRNVPENYFNLLFKNRPFKPFVYSSVTISPGATEPEGYLILIPYSGRQMLEQNQQMLPLLRDGIRLAAAKGASITGLGALTSPVSAGGALLKNNQYTAVTNGNAYTAVITFKKIVQLLKEVPKRDPHVAIVGATGSVGRLVCEMMNYHLPGGRYTLVARNQKKLEQVSAGLKILNEDASITVSPSINSVKQADIVVLLTSSADCLLKEEDLKHGAVVLDATQPRNVKPSLLNERPDIRLIDGGLVHLPYLRFNKRSIGLPKGICFACLAETMLLAQAGYEGDFSIGNATLNNANYMMDLAEKFSHLGFDLAPDHCFGKPVQHRIPEQEQELALF